MSLGDKIKNTAEEAVGRVKEAVGDVKGDKDMQADGATDQKQAQVKQVGENVKDVFKN